MEWCLLNVYSEAEHRHKLVYAHERLARFRFFLQRILWYNAAMSSLEVRMLGEFEIKASDGTERTVRTQKARCLLAYLALESVQPLPRAVLATLLWPEADDVGAMSQLRQSLHALRQAFGAATDGWLDISRYTVQFRSEMADRVDVIAFLQCVRRGNWTRAAALYKGTLLAGVRCDSEFYMAWLARVRDEVDGHALLTLNHLAEAKLADGHVAEALGFARRQLELAPAHEPAHRQLMAALAADGKTDAALEQYEHCRRVMREHFGVEPDAATTDLAQRIRAGRARPAVRHVRLPAQATPFVGRVAECTRVVDALTSGGVRLLTITGPGGIGKTRLAVQAAQEIAALMPGEQPYLHGIHFVALAGVDDADQLLPTLAAALDVDLHDGGDAASRLSDFLRDKSLLLLLDNMEQFAGRAGVLNDVLAAAPGLSILVTAREPLHCTGEQCLILDGLPYLRAHEPDGSASGGAPHDAARLFMQRAERVRPGFDFAQEAAEILEICRLVEGMPLALELAATWVRTLSCAAIVAELAQGLDLLATPAQNVAERQRSLRATLELSWQQLAPEEQASFAALSVMRGDFLAEDAVLVASCPQSRLDRLLNKSLLRRAEPGRYHFHELIRQFAAEKLAGLPELAQRAHDAHCSRYLGGLAEVTQDLHGAGQRRAMSAVAVELDNIRAAWAYAARAADYARLGAAIDALGTVHELSGHYSAGEHLFGVALAESGRVGADIESIPPDKVRVEARLLAWHGTFCRLLGRQEDAHRDLARATRLVEELGARGGETTAETAFCEFQTARLYVHARPQEAFIQYRQNLARWRALGDRWYESRTLAALGELCMWTDRYEEAQHFEEQALSLRRSLDDKRGIAQSLATLAFVANYRGEYERGQRLAIESQALLAELGERAAIARNLNDTGKLLIWAGRYPDARVNLEESARLFAELGNRERLANSRMYLAGALLHLGEYEAGYGVAQDALALHRLLGAWAQVETALFFHAWASCAVGRFVEATAMCEEALAVLQEKDAMAPRGWTLSILAVAAYGLGDPERAWQSVHKAFAIGQQYNTVLPLLIGMIVYVRAALDCGDFLAAAQAFGAIEMHPPIFNSRWWHDFAGNEVAARSDEEAVASAIARGQAAGIHSLAAQIIREPLPSC